MKFIGLENAAKYPAIPIKTPAGISIKLCCFINNVEAEIKPQRTQVRMEMDLYFNFHARKAT